MAKKYTPAIFQPTVRPDWGGTLSYLSDTEKSEILTALVKFPSVECNSRFWLETIKPDLDLQLSKFLNSNAVKSRGAMNRWGKISIPYPNHMDTISIPNDNHMDKISNTYGIDTEREREKEKEQESKSINFDTIFQAGGQLWELPSQFRKLALTKYTESEIRAFETTHSCHENPVDVCLNDIKHEPKTKKKHVEVTDYGEYEYLHSQMDKWIDYKKSRGERYKTEQSLIVCAKKLHELSGGSASVADQIIEQSIANNWAGLFALKQSNNQPQKKNWSNYVGEGSFLRDAKDDPFLEDIFNKKD